MNITVDYPIVRDGFDTDVDGIKYSKFKRRGDFTFMLEGKLDELENITQELQSIVEKSKHAYLKCTRDYI